MNIYLVKIYPKLKKPKSSVVIEYKGDFTEIYNHIDVMCVIFHL